MMSYKYEIWKPFKTFLRGDKYLYTFDSAIGTLPLTRDWWITLKVSTIFSQISQDKCHGKNIFASLRFRYGCYQILKNLYCSNSIALN